MLRPFAHPVACCWMLLRVVAQSLKPVKLFSQQLPTFLLFRDRRSVVQQCWIRLHSSSNIVGATHAHYAWFTKTYGLYPSYDALQVRTYLGVVASVCTPLPTRTQQLPTLLGQQCWELLRPFARNLILGDPGADSGGKGKTKRAEKNGAKKSKERREELFPFFTFLRAIFSARLVFPFPPLSAPGSPRMTQP